MLKVAAILACFLFTPNLHGQIGKKIILSGTILDAESLKPLPYAHVVVNSIKGTKPNTNGLFSLRLANNDSIVISHIGYQSQRNVITILNNNLTVSLTVFMAKDIRLLEAVEITPIPATVEAFKQALLEVEVGPNLSANLEEQHSLITFDMIFGPKVTYDAYENYRGIGQSKGFTLFSTGPNKGILRAIKSFKSKKKKTHNDN